MKCALYLRVSTTEQSYENQLPDLEALARARGFEIVSTYAEKVSAVKQRPAFERMLADAHRGKFQVVLVWSLDRLHRSMVGALQTIIDLHQRAVQVISVMDPWLHTGAPVPSSRLVIRRWVAEQERLRIGFRTKAGLERAKRRSDAQRSPRLAFTSPHPAVI